jgi:hypothetical protein
LVRTACLRPYNTSNRIDDMTVELGKLEYVDPRTPLGTLSR